MNALPLVAVESCRYVLQHKGNTDAMHDVWLGQLSPPRWADTTPQWDRLHQAQQALSAVPVFVSRQKVDAVLVGIG